MRDSTALPACDAVRIPGQDRQTVLAKRSKNGIPLHPKLVKVLGDMVAELSMQRWKLSLMRI